MIGKKLTKKTYTQGAMWCNANNARINPDTWIIETIPEPTVEETKENLRQMRNRFLKYSDEWAVADRPQTEEVLAHLSWRQYLRNYTNQENWWKQPPLTFEEWTAQKK